MGDFKRDRKGGRRGSDREWEPRRPERREFGRPALEMHTATCAKCGNRCEVPFRPTGERPVYCSDCFRKGDKFGERPESRETNSYSKGELQEINEKLDRILTALGQR